MSTTLSKDFTLKEFTNSQTATRHGKEVTCAPGSIEFSNIRRVTRQIFQPLRDLLGQRLIVLSGIRPPWLNKILGGSDESYHMYALAGDFEAEGMTARELAEKIANSDLPFDQCILEFGRWVHLSGAKDGEPPRRQILTAVKIDGKTVYRKGLL